MKRKLHPYPFLLIREALTTIKWCTIISWHFIFGNDNPLLSI